MKKFMKHFKEITWLFIFGCLLGFFLETIWYLLKNGILINKQGLLYGPFKPIYGFGIVIVTYLFKWIKKPTKTKLFVGGTLIGTLYEYFTNVFQEFILGTSTWNYSSFSFNINGRIYLPYCFCWGIFSLLWFNYVYPFIEKIISKINIVLTYVAAILMIINLLLSTLAVYEYSNRANNVTTKNKILKKIDILYPDSVIKQKFPKLKAVIN